MAMIDNIFLEAVKKGNKSVVKTFIKKGGINLDKRDEKGLTPLYFSALNGARDIVNILIEGGADATLASNDSLEPIHAAAKTGRKDIIKLLIENGAYVDSTDRDGKTSVMYAIENGKQDAAKFLLSLDADKFSVDNNGRTLLDYATKAGLRDLVLSLIDKDSLAARDDYGNTPLHRACQSQQIEMVRTLLQSNDIQVDAENDCGKTPLMSAIISGNLAIAELLIRAGADVNIDYNDGISMLHLAAYSNNYYIGKLLIENGVDVNIKASNGSTPLILAAQKGYNDFTEMLINNNAYVWSVDNKDKSALYYASLDSYNEVVEQLILAGAADEPTHEQPLPVVRKKVNDESEKQIKIPDIKRMTDGVQNNQFVICKGRKFEVLSTDSEIFKDEEGFIVLHLEVSFDKNIYGHTSSWGNTAIYPNVKTFLELNDYIDYYDGSGDSVVYYAEFEDHIGVDEHILSFKVRENILTVSLDADVSELGYFHAQFDLTIPSELLDK